MTQCFQLLIPHLPQFHQKFSHFCWERICYTGQKTITVPWCPSSDDQRRFLLETVKLWRFVVALSVHFSCRFSSGTSHIPLEYESANWCVPSPSPSHTRDTFQQHSDPADDASLQLLDLHNLHIYFPYSILAGLPFLKHFCVNNADWIVDIKHNICHPSGKGRADWGGSN